MCQAIIPRSVLWCVEAERLLTGVEHCRLQCMPVELMNGLASESRAVLTDIAGNAFNGANFMAVLVALVGFLPDQFKLQAPGGCSQSDSEAVGRIADSLRGLYDETDEASGSSDSETLCR